MIMCPAFISWPIELLIPGSDIILDWNADIENLSYCLLNIDLIEMDNYLNSK